MPDVPHQNEFVKSLLQRAIHDLRAPLRHISLHCEILEEETVDTPLNEDARGALAGMRLANEKNQTILDAIAKLARTCFDVSIPKRCSIGELVREAWQSIEGESPGDTVLTIADDLPVIIADPKKIGLALQEILGNSIRYRNPGQPLIITITFQQTSPSRVTLIFADNGLGANPLYLNKLTNPFAILPIADVPTGPGVGLTIVERIAEMHGGGIALESDQGNGFAVQLTLPTKM